MARTLFVTEDYIKTNTVIDDQVDAQTLLVIAYDAQELYIEPLLGSRLYNKLKSDVEGSTLAGDYLTLMNTYVVQTLLKWIDHDYLPMSTFRSRNIGVGTKSGEFGNSASRSDLTFRMGLAENKANLIGMKMIDYLECNTDLFPEYCTNDQGGELDPLNSASKTGIYLGQAKNRYGKDNKKFYRDNY
jgi:hypothetical protein